MKGYLTVQDIKALQPQEAVEIFAALLWADAWAQRLPAHKTDIPLSITSRDGGIDAVYQAGTESSLGQLLTQTNIFFQIKTGNFSMASTRDIESLLCSSPGKLKPRVEDCFGSGSLFCVVLFGIDPPDEAATKSAESRLRNYMATHFPKFGKVPLRILKANHILQLLEQYPSLQHRVKGTNMLGQLFRTWDANEDMHYPLVASEAQSQILDKLCDYIRAGESTIRVLGGAGSGKSRMVLEALKQSQLADLALYFSDPAELDAHFLARIAAPDSSWRLILVVDECGFSDFTRLRQRLGICKSRVTFISINNEQEEPTPDARYVKSGMIEDSTIEQILLSYLPPKSLSMQEYVRLCSGSPRAAHTFGELFMDGQPNMLDHPSWQHYVDKRLPRESQLRAQCEAVLLWIALFQKVGTKPPYEKELEFVAKLISEQADIPSARVVESVKILQKGKLLQGSHTSNITPQIVHIFLWKKWWDVYGGSHAKRMLSTMINYSFVSDESELSPLFGGFRNMFRYAATSSEAQLVAKQILEDPDLISASLLSSYQGGRFINNLAEVNKGETLRCLERVFAEASEAELSAMASNHNLLNSLELIANKPRYFERACDLIVKIAKHDVSRFANNSHGLFATFYVPMGDVMCPTAAPPDKKLTYIAKLFDSGEPHQIALAFAACEAAMNMHVTRFINNAYSGFGEEPEYWRPRLFREMWDYMHASWQLVIKNFELSPENANRVIERTMVSMLGIPHVKDSIVQSLYQLEKSPHVNRDKIIGRLDDALRLHKDLDKSTKSDCRKLYQRFVGNSFHELLWRHVANPQFSDYRDKGRVTALKPLALKIVGAPELLLPELDWLTSSRAQLSASLGSAIATADQDFSLLEFLFNLLRPHEEYENLGLWGGYLSVVAARSPKRWSDICIDFASKDGFVNYLSDFASRGRITDELSAVLREAYLANRLTSNLWFVSHHLANTSEQEVLAWVEALNKSERQQDYLLALDILHSKIDNEGHQSLPPKLVFEVLTNVPIDLTTSHGHEDYLWVDIANKFVESAANYRLPFIEYLLDLLSKDRLIYTWDDTATRVLNNICKVDPEIVWQLFAKRVEIAIANGKWTSLMSWPRNVVYEMSKTSALLEHVSPCAILDWIAIDPTPRSEYIASITPVQLSSPKVKHFFGRFLEGYGQSRVVAESLLSNLVTGSWSGPASIHLSSKLTELREFKKEAIGSSSLSWVTDAEFYLESRIHDEQVREERGDW